MKKLLLIAFVILGVANAQAQDVKLNEWFIQELTDDFGDPTGTKLLVCLSDKNASFSNSATTNSKLWAGLRAETDKTITLMLFEYRSNLVTAYSDTRYIVKIKDENGELYHTILTMRQGNNAIFGDGTIYELLRTNQKLKFYIEEMTEGYPSTYRFEVNTDNFNQLLDSIK